MKIIADYFRGLVDKFGRGWNQFWYTPSDPFVLSVIRIATGLVALYWHLTYFADIAYWFKAGGLLPTGLSEQFRGPQGGFNPGSLSYLSYLNTPTELHVAHVIGAVVLVLFTIGFYSRVTSILALFVTLSYIHRGPLVTSEIEPVLAMLQFYLCLGPCGACLSVDSWLARRRAVGDPIRLAELAKPCSWSGTVSLRLIQVHTCLICLMMGLAKIAGPGLMSSVEEWYDPWGAGEAVWWMIARPQSPMADLTWLRTWPYTIQAWTHAIVLFELTFPILVWNRTARPLMLGLAFIVWGSLALISGVPMLSVSMLIACLSFYSPEFLRQLFRQDVKAEGNAAVLAKPQASGA